MFRNHIYLIYMYKLNLALNNLQLLICHKTIPNQTTAVLLEGWLLAWRLICHKTKKRKPNFTALIFFSLSLYHSEVIALFIFYFISSSALSCRGSIHIRFTIFNLFITHAFVLITSFFYTKLVAQPYFKYAHQEARLITRGRQIC